MARVGPDVLSIDIVIPSIRRDPRELLENLGIEVPPGVRASWYIISDNPAVSSEDFVHDGSPVRVVGNQENLGAPLSRNVGIEMGRGDYVLFIDDDVVTPPDILGRYADAIRRYPDAAGFIGPTVFPDPVNPFTSGIRASKILTFFEIPASGRGQMAWGTTSNLLIPRRNIGDVRFSDMFPMHGGGEDIDFCLRIIRGRKEWFRTVPDAAVRHGWWGGGKRSYARFFRWGFGDSQMPRLHPEGRYLDVPNLFETAAFGTAAMACLVSLGAMSPWWAAAWVGAAALCEFVGELRRSRILYGRTAVRDTAEAALIRASNELGKFAGTIRRGDAQLVFSRFDYFMTGESMRLEKGISRLKFAMWTASGVLAAAASWAMP